MIPATRCRGFSLLEVMVALVIIAIGMLGIAKMQGLALASTSASRARALAAIEASGLAAAMQANRTYWASPSSAPGTITITTSAGTPTPASDNGAMQTAITAAAGSPCPNGGLGMNLSCYCASGYSAPCTPAAHALGLAAADIWDFSQSLASFLPTSTTTVTCNEHDTPVDCTISITWNENTVALTAKEAAQTVKLGSSGSVPVSFTLFVVP
jgi:type IV pilus assembly protein PilV